MIGRVAVALAVTVGLSSGGGATARAAAPPADLRLLVGTDLFIANAPASGSTGDAELGLSLGVGGRNIAKGLFDFRLDFRGVFPLDRKSFNRSLETDLWNLNGVLHVSRLDITFGRFQAPGGFFLTTDGVSLRLRLLDDKLAIEVFGGLRAFSAGREELHLTEHPLALPIVGASFYFRHPNIHIGVSATYTQDTLELHRGWTPKTAATLGKEILVDHSVDGAGVSHPLIEHELFLNASVLLLPHPKWTIAGGILVGSRYDLRFDTVLPYNVSSVDAAIVGSVDAYGMVDWRPHKRVRLAYLVQYDRTRIIQSRTLADGVTAGGSYLDNSLKATFRVWRNVRFDVRYRLRYRENTDVIHRPELVATADALLFGFGLFGSIGADLYSSYSEKAAGAPADPSRVIYSGGASYIHKFLDVRAGIFFTDGTRNAGGLALSSDAPPSNSHLFPFVLEAQRILFLRAFFSWAGVFVGVDGEMNFEFGCGAAPPPCGSQFRLLAQAGYSR